jgi:crossover junction endodeoxyribonuclease RuvC
LSSVLGLDPGFSAFGFSVFDIRSHKEQVLDAGVILTKKSTKKRHVLACEDNFVRAREIATVLRTIIERHKVVCLCAEAMSFPPHASVAAKMAMSWGVIAALTVEYELPLVQPTPQMIKKALCGSVSASKDEVKKVVRKRYPQIRLWLPLATGVHEHIYDSAAAVVACLNSDVLLTIQRMGT